MPGPFFMLPRKLLQTHLRIHTGRNTAAIVQAAVHKTVPAAK